VELTACNILHAFAGIPQHALEQVFVIAGELIGRLAFQPFREERFGIQVVTNIRPPALDEVLCQALAPALVGLAAQIFGEFCKVSIQKGQQRAEGFFFAAVRGSRYQQDMPPGIGSQLLDQFVTQVAALLLSEGAGVCFIHDHQFGAGAFEIVTFALGLDKLGRNDREGIEIKDGLIQTAQSAFQARGSGGQHQFGIDMELVAQLRLPLLGQLRRAKHRQAFDFAAVEQLARHQSGFDGFPDADIVRDQHAHRVEL